MTITDRLMQLENPMKNLKGQVFDFMINFINPETDDEDETDVEIDMKEASDFRSEIEDFWKQFVKENGWNESAIDVTDVWTTLPED